MWHQEPAEVVDVHLTNLVTEHASFYKTLNLRLHTFEDYERNQAEADAANLPNLKKWINDREEAQARQQDSVWILEFQSDISGVWWMAASLLDLLTFVQAMHRD